MSPWHTPKLRMFRPSIPGEIVVHWADRVTKYIPYSDEKNGILGSLFVTNFKVTFLPVQNGRSSTASMVRSGQYCLFGTGKLLSNVNLQIFFCIHCSKPCHERPLLWGTLALKDSIFGAKRNLHFNEIKHVTKDCTFLWPVLKKSSVFTVIFTLFLYNCISVQLYLLSSVNKRE